MKTIYLVSCVSKKRDNASSAELLYYSDWFQKARAYMKKRGLSWFILSAKYGIVSPSALIEPYDETLNKMTIAERRRWAGRVVEEVGRHICAGDKVVIFAGARYREFIVGPLRHMGCQVEVPMEGLKIGEQLKWLKEGQ